MIGPACGGGRVGGGGEVMSRHGTPRHPPCICCALHSCIKVCGRGGWRGRGGRTVIGSPATHCRGMAGGRATGAWQVVTSLQASTTGGAEAAPGIKHGHEGYQAQVRGSRVALTCCKHHRGVARLCVGKLPGRGRTSVNVSCRVGSGRAGPPPVGRYVAAAVRWWWLWRWQLLWQWLWQWQVVVVAGGGSGSGRWWYWWERTLSRAAGFPPAASTNRSTSVWPALAAMCRGEAPA